MSYRTEINAILPILSKGGTFLYPTDTIWGIGCDASNAEAVASVYALKKRPADKSFILLVSDIKMLSQYVKKIHPRLVLLMEYHIRPLTIVYSDPINLPMSVLATDGSVAIRLTHDPFCADLIRAFGKPIVATSANISQDPFPRSFAEINPSLLKNVDYVVQHRRNDTSPHEPSAIVRLSDKEELIFLRD